MNSILVLSNYELTNAQADWINNCRNCKKKGSRFTFDSKKKKKFDLVCVLNTVNGVNFFRVPRRALIKVVQEPNVPGSIFHRFVSSHSPIFSLIVGHRNVCKKKKDFLRFEERPPFLIPQVSPASSELSKSQKISVIASRLLQLPGHRKRTDLVDALSIKMPEISSHTFGRGRRFVESKEDALDSYMFSLAIENSRIRNYVTEKFLDCIIRGAVPLYWGAPNINDIFPKDSFVELKSLNPEDVVEQIRKLSKEDYLSRQKAITAAIARYESHLKLCCFLTERVANLETRKGSWLVLFPPIGEILKRFIV